MINIVKNSQNKSTQNPKQSSHKQIQDKSGNIVQDKFDQIYRFTQVMKAYNDREVTSAMKKKNYVPEIKCEDSTDQSKSDCDQRIAVPSPRSSDISEKIIPKSQGQQLFKKIQKTLSSTTKADKYVRLCSSFVKLLRASSPHHKKRLSPLYSQILKLRQIIRWNGLYQTMSEFCELGSSNFERRNLFDFFFKCFQLYGDILDRIMFVLDLIPNHNYQQFYKHIEKIQANCYFFECCIWTLYHGFTLKSTKGKKERRIKIAKLLKYIIDTVTSYCKFSLRRGQLLPKNIAIMNIISSLIGLFTILY